MKNSISQVINIKLLIDYIYGDCNHDEEVWLDTVIQDDESFGNDILTLQMLILSENLSKNDIVSHIKKYLKNHRSQLEARGLTVA